MRPVKMDQAEIEAAMQDRGLGSWKQAGNRLEKTFEFKDFSAAFGFMTRVALKAEALNHHPDWSNSYRKVTVELTTHDVGGISELDMKMAAAMESIAAA